MAPGEDGIRFGMLKKLPLEGEKFLLHIFNDILSNGVVLGSWQKTKIIPISMLPCARKLFEKINLTRLKYWVEKYEILSMVSRNTVEPETVWRCFQRRFKRLSSTNNRPWWGFSHLWSI
jgi:hypothetical protein